MLVTLQTVAKRSLANTLELNGAFEVDVFTIGFSTYAIITGYVDDSSDN